MTDFIGRSVHVHGFILFSHGVFTDDERNNVSVMTSTLSVGVHRIFSAFESVPASHVVIHQSCSCCHCYSFLIGLLFY